MHPRRWGGEEEEEWEEEDGVWGVKHTTFERAVYKAIPRRDVLSSSAHATVGAMVRHFWCTRARWLVLPGANARGPRVSYVRRERKKRKKRKEKAEEVIFKKRLCSRERGYTFPVAVKDQPAVHTMCICPLQPRTRSPRSASILLL